MKKWLSIVLACSYLLISLGVQLHLHYCCGELSGVHFFNRHSCEHQQDDSDHCCKKSNCCSYVHLDFRVDDSHQATSSTAIQHCGFELTPTLISYPAPFIFEDPLFSSELEASPPQTDRRYVLFHALILYA